MEQSNQEFRAGSFQIQPGPEPVRCFFPAPLPPNPQLDYSAFQEKFAKASLALGKLDGISLLLPDHELFIYSYIRKEAVLSSQIEGTQSSISDLLLFENDFTPGVPTEDVKEVSNYVRAINYGMERLSTLPLSLRLIKEIHKVLIEGTRGSLKTPGEFRTSQNWIGGSRPGNARYVPPPPYEVLPALGALENFIHNDPTGTPAIIKAGLVHAQFESIHPFLDGNGRIGRLLITFILCSEKIIDKPLLYLSLYFKQNRQEYYDRLQAVRTKGDWEGWLNFYLDGVEKTSLQAIDTAAKLIKLFEEDEHKVRNMGRSGLTALQVLSSLKKKPITTISRLSEELKISFPAISNSMKKLEQAGIVAKTSGKQRNNLFAYQRFFDILSEGPELESNNRHS